MNIQNPGTTALCAASDRQTLQIQESLGCGPRSLAHLKRMHRQLTTQLRRHCCVDPLAAGHRLAFSAATCRKIHVFCESMSSNARVLLTAEDVSGFRDVQVLIKYHSLCTCCYAPFPAL